MVFSSTIFIFFFLPAALAGYYLLPMKAKNTWLLLASLLFYAWGGYCFLPIIIYSVILNYAGGVFIDYLRQKKKDKIGSIAFGTVIALNLLNLCYWKYTGFLLHAVQNLTGADFTIPEILLPIGISFFTFQGMSYVIDMYRGEVPVQKSILRLGLYIALFPQLISGPIVRYAEIEKQLSAREHHVNDFAKGIRIFTVGLAKKAIIANSVALTADGIFNVPSSQNTPAIAWLGLICYTFQLYFDFSGYSDMAVGIGRMFGFRFPGNFNYPFISRSVTEFWRRWHISLSSWFRDYVYIPLGGSRKGNIYLNLFCVFVLTGIWHGASWNFVLWGIYFGVIVVAERFVGRHMKINIQVPKALSVIYTMFLWMMSMVLFRAETLGESLAYYKSLFGVLKLHKVGYKLTWYLGKYEMFILLIAFLAMLPLGKRVGLWIKGKLSETAFTAVSNIFTLVLLGISIIYVVTGTYNPFIYFQF